MLKNRSLVSIRDLSRAEIELVLDTAQRLENHRGRHLEHRQVALLFYEASTRTRNSFLTAVHQLGGSEAGFSSGEGSSVAKGESLHDTIKMFSAYCDAIVLRHPRDGAARWAADVSDVPIINAGDGKNQHPTQTLLDLYAIRNTQGRIENLSIGIMGDLKYGRTVHSLVDALSLFPGVQLHCISPESLCLPQSYGPHQIHHRLEDVIPQVDILYCTRIQRERLPDEAEYDKVKGIYRLSAAHLHNARPHLRVLHPLPRVDEIHPDVDATSHAYYFQQAAGGVAVRKALLYLLLGLA
ncbi:MAG: aspartate carbamoyltransferase [Vulcanimicrobiota bacterium]